MATTPELSQRIADALRLGEATLDERDRILAASGQAETIENLPPAERRLLIELEHRDTPTRRHYTN